MQIREEQPDDLTAIRRVHDLAFGSEGEGKLVDRLRSDALVVASVVAVAEDVVIGHVLFSALPVERQSETLPCASLAPVGVLPEWQRKGVGTALIGRGLALCRERGVVAVIVLGHPDYYPRFGFSADRASTLQAPFSGAAFMALECIPGFLAEGGTVRYPDAFAEVE